ncbi:hypothetical protein KIN20_019687 [Parelaphostrongylus tenuis]|uniref:Uncharacterized protein n=1 Tax=Parelaphostrongylus tenuis TaxID=148309 RepID=A0AAD5QSL8_PARTN|nr:hypothetical protein KIN20_019687 [Parelaphostrongylus tenuis]
MANVPVFLLLILLLILTAVLGCGTLPGGPMSSRTFTAAGFSLPTGMVYSESGTAADLAGMSRSADGARAFVTRIVLKAVYDVLERQGRAAGLPDYIITTILNQLTVNINYTPLECKRVVANPTGDVANSISEVELVTSMNEKPTFVISGNTMTAICNENAMSAGMKPVCVVFGNTVTALCNAAARCMLSGGAPDMMLETIPSQYYSFSGTLSTLGYLLDDYDLTIASNIEDMFSNFFY